jgi:hypothetical protein
MNVQQQTKKRPIITSDSIIESLRDISSNVGKTVVSDVATRVPADVLASLLGNTQRRGEMQQDQTVEMKHEYDGQPQRGVRENTLISQLSRKDKEEINEKINAVRAELAALSKSIASLNVEIQKAVTEQPVDAGIYHLNFLDQLKSVLLSVRQNIEDGRTWLAAFTNRKQKKTYWGMYKKHGTSFGLSNERTLATQAG